MLTTSKTILYIEDDPASRSLVERALKHAGYNVLVAERGLDGIDLARKSTPDLILTDINLPDLSGREITTTLRGETRFKRTPIVALTAQGYGQHRAMAMAAGVTGYMTKPVDVELLADKVEYYLQGGKDHIDADTLSEAREEYTQEVVGRLEEKIRDLETSNTTLKYLDKMKDAFIQITAHELRTPLTLVNGYSRLLGELPALKNAVTNDETTRVMVQGLQDGIKRMQNIINEIVTISRIMNNQIDLSIGPINPGLIAERTLANMQESLKSRHVTIHFKREEWPDKMRGDGDLLALLISNLVSNAVKYTPDGGSVFISAVIEQESILMTVKDTGIGVDEDQQEQIFERFHTIGDPMLHSTSKTAFRGGGLGLGLAVCKGIVEAHGGSIEVESNGCDPETLPGSTFVVRLPLVSAFQRPNKL